MPILKNAQKKVRNIRRKNKINNTYQQSMKTAIKDLQKTITSGEKNKAKEKLDVVITKIDKARKKGIIHQNKANRFKSKLSKSVNAMK